MNEWSRSLESWIALAIYIYPTPWDDWTPHVTLVGGRDIIGNVSGGVISTMGPTKYKSAMGDLCRILLLGHPR